MNRLNVEILWIKMFLVKPNVNSSFGVGMLLLPGSLFYVVQTGRTA